MSGFASEPPIFSLVRECIAQHELFTLYTALIGYGLLCRVFRQKGAISRR